MISSMAFRDPQLIFRTWQTSFLDHPLLAASVMNISVSLTTPLPFSWPAAADSGNWHCLGSSVNEPLVVIVLLHFHRRRASFFESGASLLRLPACQKRRCRLWMSLSIPMGAVLGPIEEGRTNIPTIRLEWIVKKPKLGVGFRQWRGKPKQPIPVGLSRLYRVISSRPAAPGYSFSQSGTEPCRQSTPSTSWPAHENQASIFSFHCDNSLPDRRRSLVYRWAKVSFRILRHGRSSSRGALESVQGWADRPLTLCSRAVEDFLAATFTVANLRMTFSRAVGDSPAVRLN